MGEPYVEQTICFLQGLVHVEPVPVWLPEQGSVIRALDAAVTAASEAGHPIKALLLTNPNNPQVPSRTSEREQRSL